MMYVVAIAISLAFSWFVTRCLNQPSLSLEHVPAFEEIRHIHEVHHYHHSAHTKVTQATEVARDLPNGQRVAIRQVKVWQ